MFEFFHHVSKNHLKHISVLPVHVFQPFVSALVKNEKKWICSQTAFLSIGGANHHFAECSRQVALSASGK